jgi:hypothetical protein
MRQPLLLHLAIVLSVLRLTDSDFLIWYLQTVLEECIELDYKIVHYLEMEKYIKVNVIDTI